MRIQHWLATVLGGFLLLSSGGNVLAQPPQFPVGNGGETGFYGSPGPGPAGRSQLTGAAVPPGMLPSPQISPFENAFDQTYVKDGLWFRNAHNRSRHHFFTAEAILSKMRRPASDHLVGHPQAPLIVSTSGVIGQLFPAVTLESAFQENINSDRGIRLRWGYTNPDDSGFEIGGYWISDGDKKLQTGIPGTQNDFSTHTNNIGIPLITGVQADGRTLAGVTVPYDLEARLVARAEAYGAHISVLKTPILGGGGGGFKLRPLYGMKYLHIQEDFSFFGSDSGFNPKAFTFIAGTTGFGVAATGGVPGPFGPYNSFLRSSVRSHLAGPEIGWQWDLGGEELKFWGQTKFSILANHEKLRLQGDDIGDGFFSGALATPADNSFHGTQRHTHVSPAFEHSMFVQAKVFSFIPLLKNMAVLKNAVFQTGYTYLYVGNLARPGESIVWQGLPLFPQIKTSRSRWHQSNWSFGVHWTY